MKLENFEQAFEAAPVHGPRAMLLDLVGQKEIHKGMCYTNTQQRRSRSSIGCFFWPMGFLRRFPISGILSLRDVEHVFSMEGSRETKIDGFLKKRSILGHFLEVLEF